MSSTVHLDLPRTRLRAALVVATLCAPGSALAQPAGQAGLPIEEIVVTSEFRQRSVLDTPAAVTVLTIEDARGQALNHIEDVLGQIPNLNFSGGSSRARFYQVRGIGERGQFEEPLNASVGLLIDGVDFSGAGTAAVLHDIQQVEVLRGPQGTLHGANALAGLIQVRSNPPTDTFAGSLKVEAGNYDARGVGLSLSGPLAPDLLGRFAARHYQDDGFTDNAFLDRSNTGAREEQSLRGRLQWTPTDRVDLGLVLGWVDVDNGYDAFSLDNVRTTYSDEPGQDQQRSLYGSLSLDLALSEAVAVQAVIGVSDSRIDYGYDEDWVYEDFDPIGYTATDRYQRDRDTLTLDVRALSGNEGRLFAGTTDWVVGAYALRQQVDLARHYTFLDDPFSSDYRVDRFALYGELSRMLGERFRLTAGIRAEHHGSEYEDSEGVDTDPDDDLWGGRVVLEYDLSERSLAYLSVTRGYKAGGFNTSGTLDAALREFDPEGLWNYEAGLKGRWLDERLTGQLALFRMQRKDVQVDTSLTVPRSDGSTEFIALTDNAAKGSNYGFEVEATFALLNNLDLSASAGLLRTRYDDFINSAGEDLDGEDQAQSPAYQFFISADYSFAPGWFARVEVEGKGAYYYSDSRRFDAQGRDLDDVRSEAYELINASVGYGNERFDLRLWGRNLTDRDYFVRGYFFGNDPRDFYTERGFYQYGDPRRYGLTLNVRI
ncbi:MAG: TonB-dependent receptor [Pseudomonadales bacterium]